MSSRTWAIILVVSSLAMIGAGLSWIYPPAGLIGVGLLVWVDYEIGSQKTVGAGKKK